MLMFVLAPGAGDERVQGLDAMDQSLALQKAERTVNGGRHHPRSFVLHRLKKAIGANGLTGLDHQIENLAARLGQTRTLIGRGP